MLILLSIVTWLILLHSQKHALGTNMKMDRCWVTRLFLHHVPNICVLRMSSHGHRQPRKRKRDMMIMDEDVEAAEIVTFEEVTVTRRDGTTAIRKVTVPLFHPQPAQTERPESSHDPIDAMANDMDMIDAPHEPEQDIVPVAAPRSGKVSFPTFEWN